MGLCFSLRRFFLSGTRRVAGGAPSFSRAASFTAFTARNALGFFLFAIRADHAGAPIMQ